MYAIIRTGGKQAKVSEGDVLDVERLRDAGDEVTFTPLVVVEDDGTVHTGKEALADAKVTAKVVGASVGPKVDIFKYRAKTGYRRRQGHRQKYTQIEVTGIELKPKKKKATPKKKAPKKTDEVAAAEKAEKAAAKAAEEAATEADTAADEPKNEED